MRSLMEDVPVAFMRESGRCCPKDNLGCLPRNLSLARPSGTNLASRSSFGTTSVSHSRTVARASTTAWPGQPARRHRHPLESVHLGEAVRRRKLAGSTVKPKLLAHILLTCEYRWPQRQ